MSKQPATSSKAPKASSKPQGPKAKASEAKAPKAKAPAVVEAPKAKRAENPDAPLTGNQQLMLAIIAKAKAPVSRADLRKATEIKKGYSRALGCGTKANFGDHHASLCARGLVVGKFEGRVLRYVATSDGKKLASKPAK